MALIEKLTAIADAIRAKTGLTNAMTLDEMAAAIEGIENGGGNTDVEDSLITRTITEYSNDRVTTIGEYALQHIGSLASVDFPEVTHVGAHAFRFCTALTAIKFPKLICAYDYSFGDCTALTSVDFPGVTALYVRAFYNCSSLISFVIRNTDKVVTMSSTSIFLNSSIESGTGYVYVPSGLAESYKAATNWSTYADQIRALEDYTVDGTTTGELDETKI